MNTKDRIFSAASILWLAAVVSNVRIEAAARQVAAIGSGSPASYRATVDRYCVTCHNDRLKTGGLSLQTLDLARAGERNDVWEKVVRKVGTGAMPPAGVPRPDEATARSFVTSLETALDAAAAAHPNPGRPVLHRLNRTEYANTIRDLLALDIDVTALLPPDEISHGFDNLGDALGVSAQLLERYLSVADTVSAIAVGDPRIPPGSETFVPRGDSHQRDHVEGLPLGTRGGLLINRTFPLDGEYEFSAKLYRTNNGFTRGLAAAHGVEFSVDGVRVFATTVGGREDWATLLANPASADSFDLRLKARVPVKAGPHAIGVTFVEKTGARNPTVLRPTYGDIDAVESDGIPKIDSAMIAGPFNPTGPGDTPSRRRIFYLPAIGPADERRCATTIVSTIARRAFRRPVTAAETRQLMIFYDQARTGRGTFDAGVQLVLRRILADPMFLFRAERDPAGAAPGKVYRVSDLELASRLSFFLWSSMPDDELLQLAADRKLSAPAVFTAQVKRMLADARAQALVTNFAGQWLQLRNLTRVAPDPMEFPDFDDTLRQSFRRETELLFETIMREDRSVLDLLTADYTFVNERLARHYGIPSVRGSQFRKIAVTDVARRGLLGHGSILTVTSQPNRTSPVKRGKWVLENLMGAPPPPPPPNVPVLEEKQDPNRPQTMKARMEEHRASPACANCHRLMDPIGLAMENFDAVGAWRTRDNRVPIDASTALVDGTRLNGVVELREALLKRPEIFLRTMTENLLTYALGREVTAPDMPTVRGILRGASASDFHFSSLISGIVNSSPFRMRAKPLHDDAS